MSTIDNSTAAYQTYQKQYDDYAAETQNEKKKSEKEDDARAAAAEKKSAENLRSQAGQYERTINELKENSNETLTQERQNARRELEQVKRENYDRFGRRSDTEARENKKQIEELQRNLEIREKRNAELLSGTEKRHEELSELMDRNARELSGRGLTEQRNRLNESHEQSTRAARDAYQQLKEESNQKISALDRERQGELSDFKRRSDRALDTTSQDYNRRIEQARAAYEKNTARQENALLDSKTDGTEKLRQSHVAETRALRNQLRDLLAEEGTYMKEKGQGTADAEREYDQKWTDRLNLQNSAFTSEIEDMKAQNKLQEHAMDREVNEALRDKDRFYTNSIRAQTENNHHALADNEKMFERNREEIILNAQKDRANSEKSHEARMADLTGKNQETLSEQAKAFQGSEKLHSEASHQDIARLQRALQAKETSSDPSDISPAAEANLRKQFAGEYAKVQAADHESFQRQTESLHRNYQDSIYQSEEDRKAHEMKTQRSVASERQQNQNEFLSHITDTENSSQMQLRNQAAQHERETDLLNRNYTRLFDHKNREDDEMLNVARNDASNRVTTIRQEAEFNSKMAQRAFSVRQNELIRDYEKKLADQKIESDSRLEEAKAQGQANARDIERRLKAQLDQQLKGNEQRLAQQDAQFKERERYLSQNYEDQIEKVKRSNALLVQKKS